MTLQRYGTVGIVPAGALGVAFYHHLSQKERTPGDRVFFVDRPGSASGAALRKAARLRIETREGSRTVSNPEIWKPDLLQCAESGFLPELLLVCTQPDQLLGIITSGVNLLEALHARMKSQDAIAEWPIHILCSNGIYFQRVRQFLVEKLEESMLLGRIPDLWPLGMPAIVGKLLRGVTIQTGQREGSGADAIYRPGARGRSRVAGGDPLHRLRAVSLLTSHGGWFELADASPTRVEFDKALINLTVNLFGILSAIDDHGAFRLVTVGDVLQHQGSVQARELAEKVVEVGRAVHAYGPDDAFEPLWTAMLRSCEQHLDHIPSSIQWVEQELRRGTLQPKLTPTEAWLLEPLIRYAHAAGLEHIVLYFEALIQQVEARLALAIDVAEKKKGETREEFRPLEGPQT